MSRDRSRYRAAVEDALGRIQAQADELRRFRTAGARIGTLADRKRELAASRAELAALVGGRTARGSAAARVVDVRPDEVEHREEVGALSLVQPG